MYVALGIVILHVLFIVFGLHLAKSKNYFPFYVWDPFWTRPDKVATVNLIKIFPKTSDGNGTAVYLPTDLRRFRPHISPFLLYSKLRKIEKKGANAAEEVMALVFENQEKRSWQILQVQLQPRKFIESRELIAEKILFESVR